MTKSVPEWPDDEPLLSNSVLNLFIRPKEKPHEQLKREVRQYGIPSRNREAQMLCRLAFSVCPDADHCRIMIEENPWIENMDPTWAQDHLALRSRARAKVVTGLVRDLQVHLDKLRSEDTCALLSVKEEVVTLKSVGPESLVHV